jgi:PadR family transcriptional regulator, regulatory protein PadR
MSGVPRRASETEQAVAEAASVDAAREAAGGRPVAPAKGDPLLGELRRAGLLPMLVLHFLGAGPSYGNQLMERVSDVTGGLVAVNPNTMYPLLRTLEGRGLIAGEWEHPERRSRRFYRLTPQGEAERERLAEEIAPHLDAVARSVELIRTEIGRG